MTKKPKPTEPPRGVRMPLHRKGRPAAPEAEADMPPMPQQGGVFVRQSDGSLARADQGPGENTVKGA